MEGRHGRDEGEIAPAKGRLAMRLTKLLRREEGSALLIAMGALTVFAIVGTTLSYYTTRNVSSAGYSKQDTRSFSLSEAGLANAVAILSNPLNNALDPTMLPSSEATASTSTYDNGTAKWWGVLDRGTAVWSIYAVGLNNNPTGPGGALVRRRLSAKVPVTPNNTQPSNSPAWNYIYARGTGNTCDVTLNNNLSGNSRFYVAGNLCLDNNVAINSESTIVRGNIDLGNNAQVGTSGTRVEAYVGGNCRYGGGSWGTPCTGNQDSRKIYSKIMPGNTVGVNNNAPLVPEPAADFAEWYQNSIPGPSQSCTTSSGTPPVFDNDFPARNNSVTPVFNLTPAGSYTCRVGTAGTPSGEISWNSTTKVLTLAGTIFIDGSATVTETLASYNGQATLYLSGTFLVAGKLCGGISGSECDFSHWNPNTEMLTIVAEGTGDQAGLGNSILVNNNGQFQGGLFGTGAVEFTNNARSDGPIVGSTVKLANNVQNDQFPTLTVVPVGMPGNPVVYAQPNPPELFAG
jgi:hypothetical protein